MASFARARGMKETKPQPSHGHLGQLVIIAGRVRTVWTGPSVARKLHGGRFSEAPNTCQNRVGGPVWYAFETTENLNLKQVSPDQGGDFPARPPPDLSRNLILTLWGVFRLGAAYRSKASPSPTDTSQGRVTP